MRLIDADKLIDFFQKKFGCYSFMIARQDIDIAPTVDAVPVVRCKDCKYRFRDSCNSRDKDYFCADGKRANKHGVWQYYTHACGYYCPGWFCSECFNPEEKMLPECPRCGAKMEGSETLAVD